MDSLAPAKAATILSGQCTISGCWHALPVAGCGRPFCAALHLLLRVWRALKARACSACHVAPCCCCRDMLKLQMRCKALAAEQNRRDRGLFANMFEKMAKLQQSENTGWEVNRTCYCALQRTETAVLPERCAPE